MPDKILIFTSTECGACNLLKEVLKDHPRVQLLDINDPESDRFLPEGEVPVPIALYNGKFYAVTGDESGIKLSSESDSVELCKLIRRNDGDYLDCGQGEIKI